MKNRTKRRRAKEQERAQAPPSGRRTGGRLGAIRTDGRTGSATSSRKAAPCEPEAEAVGLGAALALGFYTATITANSSRNAHRRHSESGGDAERPRSFWSRSDEKVTPFTRNYRALKRG